MRPLHLSLEGFMAFRDKTELDLSSLQFFVLTGPTGAGKSSLLDAISFALYGETPRMGPKDLKKLIYQDVENPKGAARVSLTFRHQGQDYRITRQLSDSGQRVELESRNAPDQAWEPHTLGKVSQFRQLMPRLLGLDFKAFSRVLMLPQGGFDHFLKQDGAKERRELLMHLAQLDVYEAIREQADQARRQAEQQQSHLKGQLSTLGDLSAEHLQALTEQHQHTQHALATAQQALAAESTELAQTERLWHDLQALATQQAEQQSLLAEAESIAALETRIQQGQSLRELGADFRQWRNLQQRHQDWHREELAGQAQQQALQQARANLTLAQARQAERQKQQPLHEARLKQLQDLQPQLAQWQSLQAQLTGHQQNCQAAEQLLHQEQKHYQMAAEELARAQQTLAQTQAELHALAFDPERLECLSQIGPELKSLQIERQTQWAHLKHQLQEGQALATAQAQSYQNLIRTREKAQHDWQAAHQASEAAQTAWEAQQRQVQVSLLRQHLQDHPDTPCPVCLQHVPDLPPTSAETEDERNVQHQLTATRQREAAARLFLQQQEQALAVLETERKHTESQLQQTRQQLAQSERDFQTVSQRLRLLLGLDAEVPLPAWEAIKAEFSTLRQQRTLQRQLEHKLQQAREIQLRAESGLALARHRQAAQAERLQQAQQHFQEVHTQSAEVQTQLRHVLQTATDFAQAHRHQLEQHQAEIARLQQEQSELQQRQQELQMQELHLHSQQQALQRQGEHLQTERDQLKAQLTTACQALGYDTLAAAEAALPQPETLQCWQQTVRDYHTQLQGLRQQIQHLQSRIGGQHVAQESLIQLRQSLSARQQEVQDLHARLAVLSRDLEQLRSHWQQAREWREKLADTEHELGLYQRIYHDLGSRQLPDFLAKRVLERVISSGSQELERLSQGRYQFELDAQEELVILDAWNAHAPRSVKTLSGGESFLASLALALALNSWLAGGIQLDSLFIDEGFGTLDAESLEQAAQVIEALQLSGKCVGIITHIPELAERFEHRIQIFKSDLGARLEWV